MWGRKFPSWLQLTATRCGRQSGGIRINVAGITIFYKAFEMKLVRPAGTKKSQNQLYFVWWEWKPIFQPWFWFDDEGDNGAPVEDDDNEIEAFHLPLHFRFNCFLFNSSKETKRVEANMMLIKTMLTRDIKWGTIAMSIVFFLRFELCHYIFFCIFYFGFCLLCFCWGACLFALAGNWRGRETPLRTFFTSWAMKNVSHFSFTFFRILFYQIIRLSR